jgi:hypothetical protein
MSLIKLNDRAVKDVTQFGSISSLGSLTHISTATASASASIEFTSGIDSTYKEYVFYLVNIHPSTDGVYFQFNFSTDGGSNYNVTKTTTYFQASQREDASLTNLDYRTNADLAQSTSDQRLAEADTLSSDSSDSLSGFLHLYNPSSTTFVKHFTARTMFRSQATPPFCIDGFISGYGNTTSSIDAVKFVMASGNIDSGQILLFGVN